MSRVFTVFFVNKMLIVVTHGAKVLNFTRKNTDIVPYTRVASDYRKDRIHIIDNLGLDNSSYTRMRVYF